MTSKSPCLCLSPLPQITYFWIKSQLAQEAEKGIDASKYASSTIVKTSAPTELGALRKGDGDEGFEK